ncbi:ABC transporter permease [Flagellimonas aequoris]|uniref:ABC transporter permease n=1 Tax=Flagellimonas aequoris TaxID=2306997 RepID=A0A418N5P2_9FLAO|nr:ABC transporter permease [Allomuricauda aequoris]RIV69529.1 ABC transporter permease [Allomuricauda aequoris]TXK01124.1 FtsX-like permease family protein [Allomuricauda aequoris]
MIKTHLKIAWRNLRRNPLFSLINILGLSTGLASAFLIFFWVTDEMTVDTFHENDQNLYQILMKSEENGVIRVHEGTQGPLAEALEKDLPEVEDAVTVMNLEREGMAITFSDGENTFKTEGLFASKNFFNVFSFPLIRGSIDQVLQDKDAIVVSENFALKLFGSVDKALNHQIKYSFFGKEQSGKITGVFEDVPSNSTMKFSFIGTKKKLLEDIWTNGKEWYNTGPQTYLVLKPNTDQAAFNKKIDRFVDKYLDGNMFSLFTRKYSDAYLKGNYVDGIQSGGRITYVRLFSFIAILVLLIACINFMNLSTARVSRRFKEIGIKKTVGSTKRTLVVQFLTESIFLTCLSLILALLLVFLLIPAFNYVSGKELDLQLIFQNAPVLILATLLTGLISGSYPAFYLSGFSPLATLKGAFKTHGGELFTRKGLVVFQFMASLVLIISVLIINNQLNFALTKPIGYQKDNIVQIDLEGKAYDNIPFFFDEVEKVEGVERVGGLSQSIVREDGGSSTYGIDWAGKPADLEVDFIVRDVDENLTQTLNIEMVEGESFNAKLGSPESYVIFNEEAIRIMGLENPVGQKINLWGEDKTILGVMKDFHTASVMQPISPVVFKYSSNHLALAMVRIHSGSEMKTIENIKRLYTDYNPGYNFNFTFQDQMFNAQYSSEQRILSLSKYFAILAIFISCLGLFGLAAFNNEMRVKEIGVRKVLGSSTYAILQLLFLDFLKLVLIAILIASPVAWYLMSGWLQQFAYRTNIGWAVFAIASILTILIALVTVSFQAIKAASANPVKSLRTE